MLEDWLIHAMGQSGRLSELVQYSQAANDGCSEVRLGTSHRDVLAGEEQDVLAGGVAGKQATMHKLSGAGIATKPKDAEQGGTELQNAKNAEQSGQMLFGPRELLIAMLPSVNIMQTLSRLNV